MVPARRKVRLSSKARAGTIRHLKLTFPAIFSSANPRTRFNQVIRILDQVCKQYKEQQQILPQFAWKPISVTSRELKIILGTKSVSNDLMITQKGDISIIHAYRKKKQPFEKRYMLQIYPDRSSISLAVAGSRELYDLLINLNQDGNLLVSQKALHHSRHDGRKILMEIQLVTMPSGDYYNGDDNYLYSLSYKQPLTRSTTTHSRTLLKAMQLQLQQLSLTPELYVGKDTNNDRVDHVQKITDLEFEKLFGVKLLRRVYVASDDGASDNNNVISDLRNISSSYRRLQPYVDGNLAYDAGIKNGSLQDVSQGSLLDAILEQVKKKNSNKKKEGRQRRLPRVVIVRVNDLVGYGLVAGENIPAGAIIGEYCGEISRVSPLSALGKDKKQQQKDNTYFATYAPDGVPGSEMFVVDARKAGNSTRFINHSDENANATWAHVFDGKWFRPIIAAVKPIPEGKQILLKYKDSYWSAKRGGSSSSSSSHLPTTPYPLE